MAILVTGGAGYIGSHVVRLLKNAGHQVVVVDDLSEGIIARVPDSELVQLDLSSDTALGVLSDCFERHQIDAVIHLAARKKVGESVEKPDWYHSQNVGGIQNLLLAMQNSGIKKLVFSSSAATYGIPNIDKVPEDFVGKPINPYGQTKLDGEILCRQAKTEWGLRQVSLRYFNVAGAGWPELADTQTANLIPIIFDQMRSGKEPVIFGSDWPTPDGTCVRDYVHVLDLAEAHLAALDYLAENERTYEVFNVGTGTGSSVLEVIRAVSEVTGQTLNPVLAPRRAGDPAYLCADVTRISQTLGWKAQRNLKQIVESAWEALK